MTTPAGYAQRAPEGVAAPSAPAPRGGGWGGGMMDERRADTDAQLLRRCPAMVWCRQKESNKRRRADTYRGPRTGARSLDAIVSHCNTLLTPPTPPLKLACHDAGGAAREGTAREHRCIHMDILNAPMGLPQCTPRPSAQWCHSRLREERNSTDRLVGGRRGRSSRSTPCRPYATTAQSPSRVDRASAALSKCS